MGYFFLFLSSVSVSMNDSSVYSLDLEPSMFVGSYSLGVMLLIRAWKCVALRLYGRRSDVQDEHIPSLLCIIVKISFVSSRGVSSCTKGSAPYPMTIDSLSRNDGSDTANEDIGAIGDSCNDCSILKTGEETLSGLAFLELRSLLQRQSRRSFVTASTVHEQMLPRSLSFSVDIFVDFSFDICGFCQESESGTNTSTSR